jgi:small neutral amino acid transporter SnatA (MarC family)
MLASECSRAVTHPRCHSAQRTAAVPLLPPDAIPAREHWVRSSNKERSKQSSIGAIVVIVIPYAFPYYIGPGTTGIAVSALIILTLSSMWNLLAG